MHICPFGSHGWTSCFTCPSTSMSSSSFWSGSWSTSGRAHTGRRAAGGGAACSGRAARARAPRTRHARGGCHDDAARPGTALAADDRVRPAAGGRLRGAYRAPATARAKRGGLDGGCDHAADAVHVAGVVVAAGKGARTGCLRGGRDGDERCGVAWGTTALIAVVFGRGVAVRCSAY